MYFGSQLLYTATEKVRKLSLLAKKKKKKLNEKQNKILGEVRRQKAADSERRVLKLIAAVGFSNGPTLNSLSLISRPLDFFPLQFVNEAHTVKMDFRPVQRIHWKPRGKNCRKKKGLGKIIFPALES